MALAKSIAVYQVLCWFVSVKILHLKQQPQLKLPPIIKFITVQSHSPRFIWLLHWPIQWVKWGYDLTASFESFMVALVASGLLFWKGAKVPGTSHLDLCIVMGLELWIRSQCVVSVSSRTEKITTQQVCGSTEQIEPSVSWTWTKTSSVYWPW